MKLEICGQAIERAFLLKGKKADPSMVHAWAEYLLTVGVNEKQLFGALKKIIDDPKIKHYDMQVSLITSIVNPKKDPADVANADWPRVLSHVRSGKSRIPLSPSKFHPATLEAVKGIGGLQRIGDSPESGIQWLEKEFKDHFKSCFNRCDYENNLAISSGEQVKQIENVTSNLLKGTDF